MQSHIKKIGSATKNMQITQSSPEKDANTANKSINQDSAQQMVKGVTNAARSTILKWYAEGPRPT